MKAYAALWIVATAANAFAEPQVTVEADAHFGLAQAPFDAPGLPDAKGQALSFAAGGAWDITPALALDLRVPFVIASVAQPAGSYVDTAALGNPQLGVTARLSPNLAVGIRAGIPLASHDAQLLANRGLAIANGLDGLAHPEMFTPGVAALTPFATARGSSGPWSAAIEARFPILLRVQDADMETAQPRSIGLAAVLAAELRRQLSHRLALAFAPALAIDVRPVTAHVRDGSRFQDLERASLDIAVGARSQISVDVQAALFGDEALATIAIGARYTFVFP
jgi:hypothetical protein